MKGKMFLSNKDSQHLQGKFNHALKVHENRSFSKFCIKLVFLRGTNELSWFLKKFCGSSKQTIVCDVSILYSLFLMT